MIRRLVRKVRDHLKTFARSRQGSFSYSTTILLVPLIASVGCAIDLSRAMLVRSKLSIECDAAMLASVQKLRTMSSEQLRNFFFAAVKAENRDTEMVYQMSPDDVSIDVTKNTMTASVRAKVPTYFMGLINVNFIEVNVQAAAVGPVSSYVDVAIVLDKSASMLLAATPEGQAALSLQTRLSGQPSCSFACHTNEGYRYSYNGNNYSNMYALSKAMGIPLRTDVSVAAAKQVISMITQADPTRSRFRISLYTIGSTTTQALAPTFSTDSAISALANDSSKLTSATSEATSRFDVTLPALAKFMGKAGDGSTAAAPMKIALILTDGAQSQRNWVTAPNMAQAYMVAPMNPDWCSALKDNHVTVGVLYSEYLPIPTDWGYRDTLGSTMASANWNATWGGVMHPNLSSSMPRRDYIPYALQDCATSPSLFMAASNSSDIQSGLSSLFRNYLDMTRMTM